MKGTAQGTIDSIAAMEGGTLPSLFRQRCERTPSADAYRCFDPIASEWKTYSWHDAALQVARWQAALAHMKGSLPVSALPCYTDP